MLTTANCGAASTLLSTLSCRAVTLAITPWRHLPPCMKMQHDSVEAILIALSPRLRMRSFTPWCCPSVCLLVRPSVACEVVRYEVAPGGELGAFGIVSDALVIAVIELSKKIGISGDSRPEKPRARYVFFGGEGVDSIFTSYGVEGALWSRVW